MAAQGRGCAVAVVLLFALLVSGSQAVQYTVGGSDGWNLQVNYDTWAAQNKFQVGDTLLFTYNAEAHNVLQVSAADYQSCNLANPIKTWDDGNTVVTLSDATTYSYVCGIPTHCAVGMKVEVSVLASASAPVASNATSPVATPPVSPPPATPPPVATPAVSPPATPPVVTPSVSSPPPASVPSPSPSSASASSPTPSPATPPPTPSPTPSPSPAPSSTATPTPTPIAPSLAPSSPLPSILTPPQPASTEPATAPSTSDASTSLIAKVLATIISAAFVGVLLL